MSTTSSLHNVSQLMYCLVVSTSVVLFVRASRFVERGMVLLSS
jgi:hypothetical protein